MDVDEELYRQLLVDVEKIIMAIQTESYKRKLKHQYFISDKEMKEMERVYHIVCAALREHIDKMVEKSLDAKLMAQVKEENEARKAKYAGRGRRKKTDGNGQSGGEVVEVENLSSKVSSRTARTKTVGNLKIESYDE